MQDARALRLTSSSCPKVIAPISGYRLADTVGQPHQPAAATTEPVRCSVGRFRTGGVHVAQERVQGGVVQNGTNYIHSTPTTLYHSTLRAAYHSATPNTPAPHQRWRKAAAGGGLPRAAPPGGKLNVAPKGTALQANNPPTGGGGWSRAADLQRGGLRLCNMGRPTPYRGGSPPHHRRPSTLLLGRRPPPSGGELRGARLLAPAVPLGRRWGLAGYGACYQRHTVREAPRIEIR